MKTYTLEEIEEHNSQDSLWMLIEDKVYDLTKFMNEVIFFPIKYIYA